jgi:TPR repeat protein
MKIKHLGLIFLLLTLTTTPVYADGYQDGVDAYNRGDFKMAIEKFTPLAEQENVKAQQYLGLLYSKGLGVKKNYKEAMKWFRKGAEQGYDLAQAGLGRMYEIGQGVSQDYSEAFKWYRKSAEQGNFKTQYNLGVMYASGKGIQQDNQQAMKWLKLSAEQGFAPAQEGLELMGERMKEHKKDPAHSSDGDWGTTWPKKVDLSGAVNDLKYNEKKFFISCVSGSHGEMEDLGIVSIGDKLYAGKYSFQVGIIEMTTLPKDLKWGNKIRARKGQTICVIAKDKESLPQEDDCDALWISSIGCKSVP